MTNETGSSVPGYTRNCTVRIQRINVSNDAQAERGHALQNTVNRDKKRTRIVAGGFPLM